MIRDTSAQDRVMKVEPQRGRRWLKFGIAGAVAIAVLAVVVPVAARLFSADSTATGPHAMPQTVNPGFRGRN